VNIKKLVAFVSAIALISLTMSSHVFAKNADNHAGILGMKKGDAMVFPMYLAADGFKTNMVVINTDNSHAVVAKVVVRSQAFSTELRDFFIYLSPNDVWKGELCYANGNIVVRSEDASVWNPATGECATAANPFEYALAPVICEDLDSLMYGYVEVFEAAAMNWAAIRDTDLDHCVNIRNAYEDLTQVETVNCLTGYGEYVFPGDYAVFPATVIAGYAVNDKLTTAVETFWGDMALNSITEVEAVLSKDNLVFPYYNNAQDISIAALTFPTKLTRVNSDCEVTGTRSPFFSQNGIIFTATRGDELISDSILGIKYSYDAYDMNEKAISECQVSPCIKGKSLLWEVNLVDPANDLDIPFEEGWSRISFGTTTDGADLDGNDMSYTGAPVIGMVVHLTHNGMSVDQMAYDCGDVYLGEIDKTLLDCVYQGGCKVTEVTCPTCPVCPVCDADHLCLCETEAACEAAGGNWCDGVCQAEECNGGVAPTCGPDNLDLCTNQTACETAGGNWCDGVCQAEECNGGGGLPSCGPDNLNLCTSETACVAAGGNWCPDEVIDCQATPCGSGPSTTIGNKTVTCGTTCFGNWTNPAFVQECSDWQAANCE
jgi:hypothetical protein